MKNLQPYYIWNSRKTTELRVGASVLKEALDRETEREERIAHAKREQKALIELQAKQVNKSPANVVNCLHKMFSGKARI